MVLQVCVTEGWHVWSRRLVCMRRGVALATLRLAKLETRQKAPDCACAAGISRGFPSKHVDLLNGLLIRLDPTQYDCNSVLPAIITRAVA